MSDYDPLPLYDSRGTPLYSRITARRANSGDVIVASFVDKRTLKLHYGSRREATYSLLNFVITPRDQTFYMHSATHTVSTSCIKIMGKRLQRFHFDIEDLVMFPIKGANIYVGL